MSTFSCFQSVLCILVHLPTLVFITAVCPIYCVPSKYIEVSGTVVVNWYSSASSHFVVELFFLKYFSEDYILCDENTYNC